MARYYFEMHGGWEYSYPYIKMGTGEDGQVTILLYKEGDEDEHVAVYGNYTVDRRTGKGKDEGSGADINLEETLFFINLEKEYEEKGEEELFFPFIYTDQERFIFSAGEIRGSGRFYYGDFYVYNRKNEVYEAQAHLTDGDTFYVIGENIYYNKYYHNEAEEEKKGSGLFRTDFSLGHEEKIGEFYSLTKYEREHDLIFAEKRPGKYKYQSSLVIIGQDGTEEKVLYDPKVLDWDFQAEELDKIYYSHIVCDGRKVYAAVEHWGHREGQWGRGDMLLNRTEIEVEL